MTGIGGSTSPEYAVGIGLNAGGGYKGAIKVLSGLGSTKQKVDFTVNSIENIKSGVSILGY